MLIKKKMKTLGLIELKKINHKAKLKGWSKIEAKDWK
jgi:hypothetical protein